MRVLLDTNVLIYREADRVIRNDIGDLFFWLDRQHHDKCIHPLTIEEIKRHKDKKVVDAFEAKIKSYVILKTTAADSPRITALRNKYDKTENDSVDTTLLNEVFSSRVDWLITEDRKLHSKAAELGISGRVFTIDAFLEKAIAENPALVDYKVLAVKKELFGNINLSDPFFASFKIDYPDFEKWFNRKADETAYVCQGEQKEILAFLYIKQEKSESENYSDIEPRFEPKNRLKIGTFKVVANGFKLGERFLKIVFDNALQFEVEEIYVTIFDHTEEQKKLIRLIQDWAFEAYGTKRTGELVFVRDFSPKFSRSQPSLTYPYFSRHTNKFIVSIKPKYHTELFPDSILRNESPLDFIENQPNRNAISKVFISRSWERNLKSGDVIVFYRTATEGQLAKHTAIATTIGVVQSIRDNIRSLDEFIGLCRKRSVFTDEELAEHWHENPKSRPFVVNFLYICSFPRRLNRQNLLDLEIISKESIRGFTPLNDHCFNLLLEHSNADQRLIVD